MKKEKFAVRLVLQEDLLGTVPKNRDVYADFIASKAQQLADKGLPHASGVAATEDTVAAIREEEVETIQEIENRGWTGFHEDDQGPFLYDYLIKGFLNESARTMKTFGLLKQLQDKFKRYCFVTPRRIRLPKVDGFNERPLRALTPLGPRVTVVRSDIIRAGAELSFCVTLLEGGGLTQKCLREVLEYGEMMGLGQWRSGGWGRFKIVSLEAIS